FFQLTKWIWYVSTIIVLGNLLDLISNMDLGLGLDLDLIDVELVVVVLVAHQALIPSNHNLLHTRIVEYTEPSDTLLPLLASVTSRLLIMEDLMEALDEVYGD
ncbi:hypothetical protein ACJX0J_014900, partial [Zea mays]